MKGNLLKNAVLFSMIPIKAFSIVKLGIYTFSVCIMKEGFVKMDTYICGNSNYNFAGYWLPNGVVFSHGKCSTLWDTDNIEWLDFYCNFGANIIGHGNYEYITKITSAMMNQSSVSMSEIGLEAARTICTHIPSIERLRFAMTGTEVVQTAFRLSRAYTGKKKILRFTGHYHGHSDNILGGTYDGVHDYPIITPKDSRKSLGIVENERIQETLIVPWNDTEILIKTFSKYHDEIACVILEPLNMNGGGIEIDPVFLKYIKTYCQEYGSVLIFDEIITVNRTGLGGMQEKLGVVPDITLLGKTLAGGALPVSVVGGKKEIMSLLDDRKVVQAGTFNGYHAGMAAVLATYDLLDKKGRLSKMFQKGHMLRNELEAIGQKYGLPLITQGSDGCFCMHPSLDIIKSPDEWTSEMQLVESTIQKKYFENNVCVAPSLRFYMNIDLTDDEILKFLDVSDRVIKEVSTQYKN